MPLNENDIEVKTVPLGTYTGKLLDVVKTQTTKYKEPDVLVDVIEFQFELTAPDGTVYKKARSGAPSSDPKSNLSVLLSQMDAQGKASAGRDIKKLIALANAQIGKTFLVSVVETEEGGTKIGSVMPMPNGAGLGTSVSAENPF